MNIQNSRHLPTKNVMVVTTGTALCIANSTRVAAYVEMSVANTNLYRLCRVVVPRNRSLLSYRGVQQRLLTSIANLLDVTIASLAWSKSTLADSDIFTRLYHG